jgi:hypothetical protein
MNKLRSGVVTVARRAVRFRQRLMERGATVACLDLDPFSRFEPDFCNCMATHTPVSRNPAERCMAGETVILYSRMGRDEIAGAQHFVWTHEA